MRWLRTVAQPGAVAELVRSAYGVEVIQCQLVRSFVNDVYRVTTPEARFALKVHRHGGRSVDEVAWEQDLLAHVVAAGVPTAAPVALADGRPAGEVAYPEGPRAFALSTWVEGRTPQPPFTDDLYRDLGAVLARWHTATDRFRVDDHSRRPFTVADDLDEPLRIVLERLATRPDDRTLVEGTAALARPHLVDLGGRGTGWGVCHGDVSTDNLLVTGAGLVLHDVDQARGGWRAGDLTGPSATAHGEAFVDGYRQGRDLPDVDLAAVPWLRVVQLVQHLHFHLVAKPEIRGTESVAEGWADDALASLRRLRADLS